MLSATVTSEEELDALREEAARLRVENEELRSQLRVEPQECSDPEEDRRPVHVLLLPDPLAEVGPGRPGPKVAANVARILLSNLSQRHPEIEWRAEHDLARIPNDAACFQLGEIFLRMWDGEGPLPRTFRVERDDEGECQLRRCLIEGEPDSERFSTGYERQLRTVDDLLLEGQAAYDADAHHHAVCSLKAVDVVLAQLNLALVDFQAGGHRWRDALSKPRPEYDPRYSVPADAPAGA